LGHVNPPEFELDELDPPTLTFVLLFAPFVLFEVVAELVGLFTTGVLPLVVLFCGGVWLLVLLLTTGFSSVPGVTPCPFDPPETGFVVL
jgi:hypothetical protein